MRKGTKAAVAAMVFAAAAGGTATPSAANDRMQLVCSGGTLEGHTIERANGSSWWDVATGAGFTTVTLQVSEGGEVVYRKDYGRKAGPAVESCTGTRANGSTWDVDLARSSQ